MSDKAVASHGQQPDLGSAELTEADEVSALLGLAGDDAVEPGEFDPGEYDEDQLDAMTNDPDFILAQGLEQDETDGPATEQKTDSDNDQSSDDPLPDDGDSVEEKTSSRAEARIQGLVEDRNALRAQLQQQAQAIEDTQKQQQEIFQSQLQQATEQNQRLQQYIESQMRAKEEEGLSDEEKWKRNLLAEAESMNKNSVEQAIAAATAPLQAKLEEQAKFLENKNLEVELKNFSQQADAVADGFLGEFSEEYKEKTHKLLSDMSLTAAATLGVPMEQASDHIGKALDLYFRGRLDAMRRKHATTAKQNKQAPPVMSGSKSGVRGTATRKFSRDEVHAAGYDNYFDAAQDKFRLIHEMKGAEQE